MSDNKMLTAYRHLLEQAKESIWKAEFKSWDALKKAVWEFEREGSHLQALSQKQWQQVQEDVEADIDQLAEYLEEFNQGVESFLEMDLPLIESYLEEKALSLSDPTEIMILRLRLNAALKDVNKAANDD
ncbi:zinc ribbon-containing protein [Thiomicrospira sp. WB1]|uniref:zinc ribbon-containing protein n=1 Tax=Thiomicrospira sp. WB1 TaxID=1685380 RepID=UPI000A72B488|nr:zinc ribbon-containing protein [Thiomicrospira sp. WB1]